MALGSPDVRYRLSAEGVAEVVAALRKVQSESEKTARGSTKAFSGFGSSLASVRGLIGAVSAAVATIGLARLVSETSDAAEELEHLHLRFSTTVEDLSALSVAARQSGTDIGSLARPLTKLFNDMTEASKDLSGEAADRFRDLGVSTREIQNFAKQDLAGRLEALARAWGKLPEGSERSNVALAELKDRGAVLIPILEEISKRGFAGMRNEAIRLSSSMSEEMIQSIGALNKAMNDLKIQSQGLASQFVSGLAPGIAAATSASIDLTSEVSKQTNIWKLLGTVAGEAIGGTLVFLGTAIDSFMAQSGVLAANTISLFYAIAAAATGNFGETQKLLKEIGARSEREQKLLIERTERAWNEFHNRDKLRAGARAKADADALADAEKKELASTKARLAANRAAVDAELALVRAGLKLREQEEEGSFASGERSVREFYAARREIVVEGIAAELAALQKQRALASADKDKGLAEIKKIDGQILVLAKDRQAQISELDQKESQELRQLAQERLQLDQKVAEARGDQHAAAMIAIDEQVQKAGELLAKLPDVDNQRTLDELRSALTIAAEFDRISAGAVRALSDLGRDRAEIERRAQAGLLSQADAENRIRDLEQQRIETLRAIGAEMNQIAQASGDPDRIARAKDFAASIDEVSISLARQGDLMLQLGPGAIDIARQSLEDFLGTGIRTAPTFAAAVGGALRSVGEELQRLLARLVAARIFRGILGILGGGAAAAGGGLANQASDVFTASTGGGVPGSGAGDVVPAMLEPGEFVTRRAIVAQPGVHAFLQALNAGMAHVASAPRGIRHYADGGLVETGSMSPARFEHLFNIGLDDGLILRKLQGPDGDRIIVKSIARNRRAASRALGGS